MKLIFFHTLILIPAHLVVGRDVDGLVGRDAEHAGLPHRGQLLRRQQEEHGPLAEVHHGSCNACPLRPGVERRVSVGDDNDADDDDDSDGDGDEDDDGV